MLVKRRDPGAPVTPFGPERAKELLNGERLSSFTVDGDSTSLTPGEDNFVRQVWGTLPGSATWLTALNHIARS